eukprot:7388349-Prymnesium_polylepis.2
MLVTTIHKTISPTIFCTVKSMGPYVRWSRKSRQRRSPLNSAPIANTMDAASGTVTGQSEHIQDERSDAAQVPDRVKCVERVGRVCLDTGD